MQNNNNGSANVSSTLTMSEDSPLPKTDMNKVNYFLSRPGLLLDQLPKNRRAELAEHVGRRSINRATAKK